MARSSILLLSILVICSVWAVQARHLNVKPDDDEKDQVELSVKAGGLPGVCSACKWAIKKVKKSLSKNSTKEAIKSKLLSVCDNFGLVKRLCRKFVNGHLAVLIEELTTNDSVSTICIKTHACKQKELEELFQSDFSSAMEMSEYA